MQDRGRVAVLGTERRLWNPRRAAFAVGGWVLERLSAAKCDMRCWPSRRPYGAPVVIWARFPGLRPRCARLHPHPSDEDLSPGTPARGYSRALPPGGSAVRELEPGLESPSVATRVDRVGSWFFPTHRKMRDGWGTQLTRCADFRPLEKKGRLPLLAVAGPGCVRVQVLLVRR